MSGVASGTNNESRETKMGATDVIRTQKPWGHFEQYAHNLPCTVKIITVEPGGRLSRQYHIHRDELWVVLDAGAEVELDEEVLRPGPSEELFVPRGTIHRLSCIGDRRTRILEVSFGVFDEDDIVRLDDVYGRADPTKDGEVKTSEVWMFVDGRLQKVVGI